MLTDNMLKRLCKPVVLRRAHRIVEGGESIYKRKCRFEEDETILRARVDSQASWDEAHRTMVVLDEAADAITYYECDCRPAHAADSPCDHVAAVVLDFMENPEQYEGHEKRSGLVTSRSVRRLMDSARGLPSVAMPGVPTEIEAGTVCLEATLAYEVGFDVRFRLVGSKGSYALKSIGEFVQAIESREVASYGQRLAFEHVERSFTDQTWDVARFLVRCVQNRRSYALERSVGRQVPGSLSLLPGRELHLSAPELWELLDLYEAVGLQFEDRSVQGVGGDAAHPVRVVESDPVVDVDIVALEDGSGFEFLRSGHVRIVNVGGNALAWDERALYRCSSALAHNVEVLSTLLANPSERMVVSNDDAPAFCVSVLRQLESCAHVRVPEELERMRPRPCVLEFYVDYDARRSLVSLDARATYGEVSIPLFSSRVDGEEDAWPQVVRDFGAEARGREVIRRYFAIQEGRAVAQARGEDLGAIVYEGVAALQEVGTVFAYPAFARLRNTSRPRVRVGLSVRSRLLELDMQLEGVDQDELAGLLESYRRAQAYHQLKDGTVVRMADAELAEAAALADELDLSAKQLGKLQAIPAYKAFVLDALVADDEKDDSFASYVDRVRAYDAQDYQAPASLGDTLRSYQHEGFRWLCGLSDMGLGGILADEMGLGKSVQLIAFLLAHYETRVDDPSLVVCPSSLVYNWLAEFSKFAPGLKVRVVAGTPQEREAIRLERGTDVLITSYDLLRRDIAGYEDKRLWCVALDEAQYIKNPATQAAQAVKALVAQNHVALTGTPVENRLSELWSIFDFLMPGLLGSYGRFRERFERPIVEDESTGAAAHLRDALRPFILRRTKQSVAKDLPEKIEQVVRTHMDADQRRLYDAQVLEVRNQMSSGESFGESKFQILALLTRLRQICCDPKLLYDDCAVRSCKTEAVLTLVERTMDAGEKVLVFSQFTSYLAQIAAELDARGIAHYQIDGSTPSARRLELVDAFNEDETPVFLVSLKAGGTGLNLTGATVVIHADPWWNVAAQNQATDRAHRIGQTRRVTVYKVIAADTIEERIIELQQSKAELADAVVQGDVSSVSLAKLTPEDLEDLLG